MSSGQADLTVRIVGDDARADQKVAIIGDQVIDVSGAVAGDFIIATGNDQWQLRHLADGDIPAVIARDFEVTAAVAAEASARNAAIATQAALAASTGFVDSIHNTGGNTTLVGGSTGAWTEVSSVYRATVNAKAGDWLEASINAQITAGTAYQLFDVQTLDVSNAPVSSFARNGAPAAASLGIQGWLCGPAVPTRLSGVAWHQVGAGDVVAGQVTISLFYRSLAGTDGFITADINQPTMFVCRNHG